MSGISEQCSLNLATVFRSLAAPIPVCFPSTNCLAVNEGMWEFMS